MLIVRVLKNTQKILHDNINIHRFNSLGKAIFTPVFGDIRYFPDDGGR